VFSLDDFEYVITIIPSPGGFVASVSKPKTPPRNSNKRKQFVHVNNIGKHKHKKWTQEEIAQILASNAKR
jgi:hypothetical protein